MKGKEQNTKPSKLLIQKIKRETDRVILNEFIRNVVIGNITVSEMEMSFDMFFCIYDESGTNKYTVIKVNRIHENNTFKHYDVLSCQMGEATSTP